MFINEIVWWKENIIFRNGKWIWDLKVDIYLEIDVLKVGWGVNLNGKIIGGRWLKIELVLYINILEIMVIKFVL